MKALFKDQKTGVYDYDVNGETIAVIDKDSSEGTIVILNTKDRYLQRFFLDSTDKYMVESCQLMKKLGIKSL